MLMIRFCCNERIVELLADLKIRIYSPCNQARKDSVNDKDYCNKVTPILALFLPQHLETSINCL